MSHDTYGDGEIIEVNPMGSRHLVRVKFAQHGAMALVLSPEDIVRG